MKNRIVRGLLATAIALLAIPARAPMPRSSRSARATTPRSPSRSSAGPTSPTTGSPPAGDLEAGTAGWALSGGAGTVAGGEPWNVTGQTGRRALSLPAGASATTPATCVNAGAPTFRFFARTTAGLLPLLKVDLVYRDGALGLLSVPAGIVTPTSSWQPTLAMLTHAAVGGALAGGEAPMSLRFTALTGTWQVDDVFVDPYARR